MGRASTGVRGRRIYASGSLLSWLDTIMAWYQEALLHCRRWSASICKHFSRFRSRYAYASSQMRLGIDATRISDRRTVVLKRLLPKEGPHELEINKLFSTEPLASNPRNHCARLLDVIQLPGDPPILVHPMLCLYYDPPIRTVGEFVTFFEQICEVCLAFFCTCSLNGLPE